MDWKDLIKEAGLKIAGILGLIVVSGWQFYVSFLHGLGARVQVFIPAESLFGAGIEPFFTVLLLPCVVACLLAWAHRDLISGHYRPRIAKLVPSLLSWGLPLAVVVLGALLPYAIVWSTRTSRPPISLSEVESAILAAGGALLGFAVFDLVRRFEATEPTRYFLYGVIFLLFLGNSVFYAIIRGRHTAQDVITLNYGRARLTLTDPDLRKQFDSSWFVSVFETRDDILFLRFAALNDTNGHLLLVKKAEIKAIEYPIESERTIK